MPLAAELERASGLALREMTKARVAVAFERTGETFDLFADEALLVARAVPKRRAEFAAGRHAARRALGAVGCAPQPLMVGRLREPIWPDGFAGSISHDGRFATALACPDPEGRSRLSIDVFDRADRAEVLDVLPSILHPHEQAPDDATGAARLFSAKEAAVKIASLALGDLIDLQRLMAVATDYGFEIALDGTDLEVSVRTLEVERVIVSLGMAYER